MSASKHNAIRRWLAGPTTLLLGLVLMAPPAVAASDWDPNDVEGPLDLRWVGATFTSNGDLRLVVSFYSGFMSSALRGPGRGVRVRMAAVQSGTVIGYFRHRRDGSIVFRYGDGASRGGLGCIDETAPVVRPSVNVLRVAVPIIDGRYRVHVTSRWILDADPILDRTERLDLGRHVGIIPPCG